ncbi:MAG: pyridoxal-phosphate dependent enzyme [Acidobacteriota bacterium]|nr:pyridoxal-phosphate dependent enzyme [Acidobacteriota bacterium]
MNVAAAAERLARYAHPTPVVQSLLLSRELGCTLFVKNETVSPIASFKWRGALNDILRAKDQRGVVTSSTGNHGQGVVWAARTTGVAAHVFLPVGANPIKRAKIELLGATIHDIGYDLDAAKELAQAFAREEGLRFIDDGESEGVIEGAATVGLELTQQLEQMDVAYVPMGSGSLASGVARAIKEAHPHARVVAVQSSGSPAMVESFRAQRPIERPADTIGDGLICRVPAELALRELLHYVDDAVLVSDDELLHAARSMILGAQILVEPSGAAGLAAARRWRDDVRGKHVVVIATGANITAEVFRRLHAL